VKKTEFGDDPIGWSNRLESPDRCRTRRVEYVDAIAYYVQTTGNRRLHYDKAYIGLQKKSLAIRQEIAKDPNPSHSLRLKM
jgi:hypothetical protein